MAQIHAPGVYTEEAPAAMHRIAAVPTSIAAFVGYTSQGVTDQAVAIQGLLEFEHEFGGVHADSPLSFAVSQFFANGGSQAWVVRVTDAHGGRGGAEQLVGNEQEKSGLYALLACDQFNLLLIPETFDMLGGEEARVISAAVALCEAKRAFYIVDAPANRTLADISQWAHGISQSRNAATYFPPVRVPDPNAAGQPRTLAPSGTLAGVYARTDSNHGVWKAPAGADAQLLGVVDLALALNDMQNGQINPQAINVLRTFPAFGHVAWGARTLKGSDAQADGYKYIPVRRLALFIEESLYRGTQWVVFEHSNEALWAQLRLSVGAFMLALFRQGAFQGRTPEQAYFVKCDEQNHSGQDRERGVVSITIGFAALKPGEFVMLTIQQMAIAAEI